MRPHEVISELVEQRGISVRELSRRLNVAAGEKIVSPNTVAKWLTPEGDPRLSELAALARFFGVPLSRLVGGGGMMNWIQVGDEFFDLDKATRVKVVWSRGVSFSSGPDRPPRLGHVEVHFGAGDEPLKLGGEDAALALAYWRSLSHPVGAVFGVAPAAGSVVDDEAEGGARPLPGDPAG